MSDDGTRGECGGINPIPASDGGRSSVDRILTALQDDRRRYLLYHLREEDPTTLDDAARHVAAWDHDCDPADVPDDVHDRVRAELYHTHLPKLDDMSTIDYDERTGAIRLHDPADRLDDFLDLTRAVDDID